MTPLLDHLQAHLLAAHLPGFGGEHVTLYISDAVPEYATPYDPEGRVAADAPISLGWQPPATLVIRPFSGDLLDLILTINLILDDLAPASRGNAHRLRVSAEPLDERESIVVITLTLREVIRYIPAADGNLTINGIHYRREIPHRDPPQPLTSIRHVG